MSIPPVPNADGSIPEPVAAPVEPAPVAAPAAAPAPATPAPEAAPTTPAAAPWAADLEERFTDPAIRAEVDAYLREKQQPYITKLEQERAEALDKAWVFDELNDDPATALREITNQIYGDEVGKQIADLIGAGATIEQAEAAVTGTPPPPDPEQIDLDKLPPEVRDAVEFARKAREAEAAAEAKRVEDEALAEATKIYDAWRAEALEKNPDIVEQTLHAFVFAADGDMEQGLANYRAVYPAPTVETPPAPATLGPSGASGAPASTRRFSSLGEAAGAVYDAAAGTVTL